MAKNRIATVIDAPRTARRATALPPDERRTMIVEATLPLLLEHGEMVTTREIADAAGIAEGTIFRVFPDKDALIEAVLEAAFDVEPLERALAGIDPTLPFEDRLATAIVILQQRVVDIWRLVSSVGTKFHDKTRRPIADSDALVTMFETHCHRLTVEPAIAARLLRALTMAATHPMLVGEPMAPSEIAQVFLFGIATPESPC